MHSFMDIVKKGVQLENGSEKKKQKGKAAVRCFFPVKFAETLRGSFRQTGGDLQAARDRCASRGQKEAGFTGLVLFGVSQPGVSYAAYHHQNSTTSSYSHHLFFLFCDWTRDEWRPSCFTRGLGALRKLRQLVSQRRRVLVLRVQQENSLIVRVTVGTA